MDSIWTSRVVAAIEQLPAATLAVALGLLDEGGPLRSLRLLRGDLHQVPAL